MERPVIAFKSGSGEKARFITVVDGTPFYKSTGTNSGLESVWLPFTMMNGTKEFLAFPERDWELLKKNTETHYPGYLIKHMAVENQPSFKDLPKADPEAEQAVKDAQAKLPLKERLDYRHVVMARFKNKKHLITALKLQIGEALNENPGGLNQEQKAQYADKYMQKYGLREAEVTEIIENPIELEISERIERDPDAANEWLIDNGAVYANLILTGDHSLEEKLEEETQDYFKGRGTTILEDNMLENQLNYYRDQGKIILCSFHDQR